jgi:HD-like signal output (HDOD) protein
VTAPLQADPPALVERLAEELERLPASRGSALRTIQVADDPEAGAADVAAVAGLDPALTARILRLANSAYYGLCGRVGTTSFAVTVVGFSAVRSLAAVAAAGLTGPDDLPPGFWRRAAAVAAATSLVAPRVRADVPEAFCAGLLHDLGVALLRAHDRALHERVQERITARPGPWALVREEVRAYGGTHADLGAHVLRAWSFPDGICAAVAGHHSAPATSHAPLLRALLAGLVLADLADTRRAPTGAQRDALLAASVASADVPALVVEVAAARDALTAAFTA